MKKQINNLKTQHKMKHLIKLAIILNLLVVAYGASKTFTATSKASDFGFVLLMALTTTAFIYFHTQVDKKIIAK